MVLDRSTGVVEHRVFRDLPDFLRVDDCLVLNTTRVVPARFKARRDTGGRIGGLFLREHEPGRWTVLLAGAGRIAVGESLAVQGGPWIVRLVSRGPRGACEVDVRPPDPAETILARVGTAPLPPYIRRNDDDDHLNRSDLGDYQTVYAERPGAVAAPTAGMHFTQALLDDIRRGGVARAELTLHVGLGTFVPVEADDLADHPSHREWFELLEAQAATIRRARAGGRRIIAVGTTAVRVLETCAADGELTSRSGWTDLFIYPPYTFHATDALLTNFHLPGSTLLALVFAFAGRQAVLNAYRCAINEGYRFYSYGDAMLIV